jgi:tRNA (guanine37-N1)-methyltransferase
MIMKIDVITAFPDLIIGTLQDSILKRAQQKELVQINLINLRQYGVGKHRQIDDYSYGGSAGMVFKPEPLYNAIEKCKQSGNYEEIIYFSPDGELLTQKMANEFSLLKEVLLLCGHYKGIDERIRVHCVTREISIGDYVLSGGELPAAVWIDSVVRLLPGVLSDETSALFDSYQDELVAPPVFTRPASFNGWEVPEILMSGNQGEIEKWLFDQSIDRTRQRRPGMLDKKI